MKNKTIYFLRNCAHPIGTATVTFIFAVLIMFHSQVYWWQMILIALFGGIPAGGIIGGLFELYKLGFFKQEATWHDVKLSAIGAPIGLCLGWILYLTPIYVIDWLLNGLFVALALDTIHAFYKTYWTQFKTWFKSKYLKK